MKLLTRGRGAEAEVSWADPQQCCHSRQSSATQAVPWVDSAVLLVLLSHSGAGGISSPRTGLHLPACSLYLCAASRVKWDRPSQLLGNLRALFPAQLPPVEKVFLFEVNSKVIFKGFCSLLQWGTGTPRQISDVPLLKCLWSGTKCFSHGIFAFWHYNTA